MLLHWEVLEALRGTGNAPADPLHRVISFLHSSKIIRSYHAENNTFYDLIFAGHHIV